MATNNTIINDLIMVKLSIEYDTGYRASAEMSRIIHEKKETEIKAMRTGVVVIPKCLTSEFTSAVSTLRKYYLNESLPWDKGNWRVVPVTAWQGFKSDLERRIRDAKDGFYQCYVKGYDGLEQHFKSQIGKLDIEFPEKQAIVDRFNIEYKVGQVASPDDIRIQGIDTVERKRISDDMKKQYGEQVDAGLNELAKRLTEAAEDIGARVADPDQKSKKYTRSLENLQHLADTAEKLNVTGNDAIKAACKTIKEDISQWSPEAIKTTPIVRDHIASATGSVQDRLAGLKI